MKPSFLLRCSASLFFLLLSALPSPAAFTARGSDSTISIVKALAENFQRISGIQIQVEGGGSGAGAKAALAGEVQLAFLSRALNPAEIAGGLSGVAYAADAVAIIVHPANPLANASLAELKALFSGAVTAWPDGKQVVIFNRNTDSGTREIVQEHVLGKGTAFSAVAAIKHDGILLSSVAKLPGALSYDGFSHADPRVVKIIAVNGLAPTPQSIRSATYPLTRIPTLATKGAPTGEVKAFLDFVLSPDGQAIVAAHGLLPLH